MTNILSGLDERAIEVLKDIGSLAHARGMKAYLVGGPVRDLFLKTDVLDLDITIEGKAMKLAEDFAEEFAGQFTSYPSFKTATVNLSDGRMVDFVTARKEAYPKPGAFPVVTPSTLKDDLYRRDFTVNAMAIAINPNQWGKLVDPYGGMDDLRAKKIRILHAKSFIDDPTRILRAARFAGRFGFSLEEGTLNFLRAAVRSGAMKAVKGQRYAKEMTKIDKEKNRAKIIERLAAWDALV